MHSLYQRLNECSLASIATLNGLTQSDYFVLSDLAREAGANFRSHRTLGKAIRIGMRVARDLGFRVPADYPGNSPAGSGTTQAVPSAFDGKGIVRIQFKRKRCRNWSAHVIAFNRGVFYESEGQSYNSWAELTDTYVANGNRELIITRIFK